MVAWSRRLALGALVLVTIALVAGLAFEQWARWSTMRGTPPVGALVEVDGRRSHLHCTGEGAPTVILEAGLDAAGSHVWVSVQPHIAAVTRVCSYDRAGILWSQARSEPRDALRITDELHALLEAGSESPPYVLVGHSLGGLLSRVYAERHPSDVVGLVFVDASHPEQMERLPTEAVDLMSAGPPRALVTVLAATGVLRLLDPTSPDLPDEARDVVRSFLPTSLRGMLGERDALDAILAQAADTGTLGERPVVVLTAGSDEEYVQAGLSDAVRADLRETWLVLQAELAGLSSNASHRVVADAGHYVQWDDPGAVVAAVLDVVGAVRRGTRLDDVSGADE